MGAIRLANCNLHNQAVGEGISAAVQDVNIRQYMEQHQQHSDWTSRPAPHSQGPQQQQQQGFGQSLFLTIEK